jgi:hypothetical protein
MLSEKSSSGAVRHNQDDVDFTKTTLYESLTAELLAYKRQRDAAREKAARYKSQLLKALEELTHQTSKFELLAQEFRRLIKLEHHPTTIPPHSSRTATQNLSNNYV